MEFIVLICAILGALAPPVHAQVEETCNGRIVSCFVNPCSVATCPGVSNAECIPNFCNKCSAHFVVRGVTVSEQDCGETPGSQTSRVDKVNTEDLSLQDRPGLLGRSTSSGSKRVRENKFESSPLLGLLFGGSQASGSFQTSRIETPPAFKNIVSRISQWQPIDLNARERVETFIGGLLNKAFSRLG